MLLSRCMSARASKLPARQIRTSTRICEKHLRARDVPKIVTEPFSRATFAHELAPELCEPIGPASHWSAAEKKMPRPAYIIVHEPMRDTFDSRYIRPSHPISLYKSTFSKLLVTLLLLYLHHRPSITQHVVPRRPRMFHRRQPSRPIPEANRSRHIPPTRPINIPPAPTTQRLPKPTAST